MIDFNMIYKLILSFLYSVFATFIAMPYIIEKCKKYGYIAPDMHKFGKPKIPVLGGIAILGGVLVSLVLTQLLMLTKEFIGSLFIFYFVVIVYAMYGLLDDIFHFRKRYDKVIVLLVLSIPIVSLLTDKTLNLGFMTLNLGMIYLLIFVPVYIMVVANLINLHAGFNGLGPGSTWIMLVAAGIKSYMVFDLDKLMFLMPILGALTVFLFYNKYPAKVFDGNNGALLMGSALGAFLIINKLELFGMIILIPHIITFILVTWILGIKKVPDIEFPEPRKDGLIVIDKSMRYKSLKNVVCTLIPCTEKKATDILLAITVLFCIIGVIWF